MIIETVGLILTILGAGIGGYYLGARLGGIGLLFASVFGVGMGTLFRIIAEVLK